ncbi:hypothetical protein ElyMa_001355300 [Elysia marginata]|uniref:Uncharacterized protein n=1 Tax=Elysia marginata TaxID=1093978 RepID=A0AAV4IPV9_9GAST|nr:hypothetical protein ElyMa_001355300 [Elysia marginata]
MIPTHIGVLGLSYGGLGVTKLKNDIASKNIRKEVERNELKVIKMRKIEKLVATTVAAAVVVLVVVVVVVVVVVQDSTKTKTEP